MAGQITNVHCTDNLLGCVQAISLAQEFDEKLGKFKWIRISGVERGF